MNKILCIRFPHLNTDKIESNLSVPEACPSITGLFRQKGAFQAKKGLFGQKRGFSDENGAIVNFTSFILSTKGMYFEQ